MERWSICIVATFSILWNAAIGFNVDSNQTIGLVKSPVFEAFQNEITGKLSPYFVPSFFGYQLSIEKNSPFKFSLKVGAPKVVDPANPFRQTSDDYRLGRGDVLDCGLSFIPSSSRRCTSSSPPGSALGDAFGLSLNIAPNRRAVACSPTKIQRCRSAFHNPGFCYNKESINTSSSWMPDPRTANETCRFRFIDMVFLLDASGSIDKDNFNLVKSWTKAVANGFRITDGSTRIGVVRYSFLDTTRDLNDQLFINTEIPLGSVKNREEFNRRVDSIEETNFQTFTAHALNKTETDFRSSDGFYQPNTAKILILLTDGRSTDGELLPETARYIRSLGITTFAVGVGDAVVEELRTVATGTNSDERVFYVSNFDLLDGIVSQIGTDIRITAALEGSSSSDSNNITNRLEYAQYGFSVSASLDRKVS